MTNFRFLGVNHIQTGRNGHTHTHKKPPKPHKPHTPITHTNYQEL